MSPIKSRGVVALVIFCSAMASGGWLLGRSFATRSEAPVQGEKLFDDVMGHIQRFYVDSLSTNQLLAKALDGMLEELGDPNTVYLEPARLRRLNESLTGNYTGSGLRIDSREGWPIVIAALPGGPAERAGLLPGDRIVEIDSRSTRGWTDEEIRAVLRGAAGTTLRLIIDRPGQPERLSLSLTRGEVHRQAVRRSALLNDGVAYVGVTAFSDSTEREVTRALDSLASVGMRSLILDLRGNPGGLLAQGVAVADLFLDPGQKIVSIRGRKAPDTREYQDSLPQRWPTLPMAILVDEATASAAEIVAGALQDHDRALVMGRQTYGKGSAQAVFETFTGGGLKLTTARWLTPSGRALDRSAQLLESSRDRTEEPVYYTDSKRKVFGAGGLSPDIEVRDAAPTAGEMALQRALGDRVPAFRDALADYAVKVKASGRVASRDFTITPQMLEEFWRDVRARGVVFDRSLYDGARPLVEGLLAREIARYVFGPEAEARRAIDQDLIIKRAAERLRRVGKPAEVFAP